MDGLGYLGLEVSLGREQVIHNVAAYPRDLYQDIIFALGIPDRDEVHLPQAVEIGPGLERGYHLIYGLLGGIVLGLENYPGPSPEVEAEIEVALLYIDNINAQGLINSECVFLAVYRKVYLSCELPGQLLPSRKAVHDLAVDMGYHHALLKDPACRGLIREVDNLHYIAAIWICLEPYGQD